MLLPPQDWHLHLGCRVARVVHLVDLDLEPDTDMTLCEHDVVPYNFGSLSTTYIDASVVSFVKLLPALEMMCLVETLGTAIGNAYKRLG
jgi:hypothetical protein